MNGRADARGIRCGGKSSTQQNPKGLMQMCFLYEQFRTPRQKENKAWPNFAVGMNI
jgi:hypothetical protein